MHNSTAGVGSTDTVNSCVEWCLITPPAATPSSVACLRVFPLIFVAVLCWQQLRGVGVSPVVLFNASLSMRFLASVKPVRNQV